MEQQRQFEEGRKKLFHFFFLFGKYPIINGNFFFKANESSKNLTVSYFKSHICTIGQKLKYSAIKNYS